MMFTRQYESSMSTRKSVKTIRSQSSRARPRSTDCFPSISSIRAPLKPVRLHFENVKRDSEVPKPGKRVEFSEDDDDDNFKKHFSGFDDNESTWLSSDSTSISSFLNKYRFSEILGSHHVFDDRLVLWLSRLQKAQTVVSPKKDGDSKKVEEAVYQVSTSIEEEEVVAAQRASLSSSSSSRLATMRNGNPSGDSAGLNAFLANQDPWEEPGHGFSTPSYPSGGWSETQTSISINSSSSEPNSEPSTCSNWSQNVSENEDWESFIGEREPIFWPFKWKFDWNLEDDMEFLHMSSHKEVAMEIAGSDELLPVKSVSTNRNFDLKQRPPRRMLWPSKSKTEKPGNVKATSKINNNKRPSRLRKSSKSSSKAEPMEDEGCISKETRKSFGLERIQVPKMRLEKERSMDEESIESSMSSRKSVKTIRSQWSYSRSRSADRFPSISSVQAPLKPVRLHFENVKSYNEVSKPGKRVEYFEDDDDDFKKHFSGWDDNESTWLSSDSTSISSFFDEYQFWGTLGSQSHHVFDDRLVFWLSRLQKAQTVASPKNDKDLKVEEAENQVSTSMELEEEEAARPTSLSSINSPRLSTTRFGTPSSEGADLIASLANQDPSESSGHGFSTRSYLSGGWSETQSSISINSSSPEPNSDSSTGSNLSQNVSENEDWESCIGEPEPIFWPFEEKFDCNLEEAMEFLHMYGFSTPSYLSGGWLETQTSISITSSSHEPSSDPSTCSNSLQNVSEDEDSESCVGEPEQVFWPFEGKLDCNMEEAMEFLGMSTRKEAATEIAGADELLPVGKAISKINSNKRPSRLRRSSKNSAKVEPAEDEGCISKETRKIFGLERIQVPKMELEKDRPMDEKSIESTIGLHEFDGHGGVDAELDRNDGSFSHFLLISPQYLSFFLFCLSFVFILW